MVDWHIVFSKKQCGPHLFNGKIQMDYLSMVIPTENESMRKLWKRMYVSNLNRHQIAEWDSHVDFDTGNVHHKNFVDRDIPYQVYLNRWAAHKENFEHHSVFRRSNCGLVVSIPILQISHFVQTRFMSMIVTKEILVV